MTPWKIAMEAAAKTAWEAWHWPASEGSPDPTMDAIRSLPMPPAFRAEVEAEAAELRGALEEARAALLRISNREIENTRRNPDWPRRIARAALPTVEALLSRLEAKGESQ